MDNGHVRGHKTSITVTTDTSWQPENGNELTSAIARIERELPGWWWSVGACHVSSDATCGPDRYGPDAWMFEMIDDELGEPIFDCDLRQPSTCGQSLNRAIDSGLVARKKYADRRVA